MANNKKNILIFFSDDHAQWALGCYGNSELRTPNLDHLAETGVQMMNAFTPTPVCSPARANFLTGKLASQHGIHDYLATTIEEINNRPWLEDEITLPTLLQKNGYQTALCGKWHMGGETKPQAGFDHWFSLAGDYPFEHGATARYSDQGEDVHISGYATEIITDNAIKYLNDLDKDRPFFLLVGYNGTHSPWSNHPEQLVSQYRQGNFDDIPTDEIYPFGEQALESINSTRDNPREALAQYYAAVSHQDEAAGRLIDELEALGLREDTLIVYTSDHGLNCEHHGIWGKGNGTLPLNMVEESIRVPLIFNQPKRILEQQRREEFVDHCDLFQTLLAYAEIEDHLEQSEEYPGQSYLAWLDNSGDISDWREIQFCEYGDVRMARTPQYKLICRPPVGPSELFDLDQDPRENINLINDPTRQDVINDLMERLEEFFSQYEHPEKSGLNVRELPKHNNTEAWRTDN